jgi:hypothetical protein
MLSALNTGHLYPRRYPWCLLSVMGWVDPRDILRPEGLIQRKIPMTTSTTETVTFRHHVPIKKLIALWNISSYREYLTICKGKAVLLQTWSGPEGSRKLRFPDFMTTAQDGGKVVSLTHRPPLPPGNTPGTHFCSRLIRPQGHSATGRIMSTEKVQWDHQESNPRPASL